MGKPPEIPDLELPTSTPSRRPSTPEPARPAPAARDDVDDVFGGGLERGTGSLPPPTSAGGRGKHISVDFGVRGDDGFEDNLERGGGYEPAHSSSTPSGRPVASRAPASMNLDVAYKRPTAPAVSDEPGFLEKLGGHALAFVGLAAAVAPLLVYVHRVGAFNVMTLVPRAFDASSLPHAGAFAGVFLVSSLTFGYLGIKARPRSWAMVLSAFLFLVSSLAMVTVALVSTDENPVPPDGARLIPYTLPLALALLGVGLAGRGYERYFDGGAKRFLPFLTGIFGGLVVYAAIALSPF